MKVVVQKFGGTCVESEESQLFTAERIMEARDEGLRPVVVVSAMGREGQPYSTAELVKTVGGKTSSIHPRTLDLLMSCGEIISTVAMANLLHNKGYGTIALTGGQAGLLTDEFYGHARIVGIKPDLLLRALQDDYMVFVAGFQGNTHDHQITTLGAGGSDYTAVALTWVIQETPKLPFGEKLEVVPLQIYKEVDGVMTARPESLVGKAPARTIGELTYDECVWMCRLGAEVLQTEAAEMARERGIAFTVGNFRKSASPGTRVGVSSVSGRNERATAIADQARLLVYDLQVKTQREALQVKEWLDRWRLTYYELESAGSEVRLAVRPFKYRDVTAIVGEIVSKRGVVHTVNTGDFALVSVVGEALRGRLSTWAEESNAVLAKGGVEVHGRNQGELSLSFLVPEAQRVEAVGLLHERLVVR